MTLYSLRKLAKATMIGEKTLRSWRGKGWLKPTASVGGTDRYSMDDFKRACEQTLQPNTKDNRQQDLATVFRRTY